MTPDGNERIAALEQRLADAEAEILLVRDRYHKLRGSMAAADKVIEHRLTNLEARWGAVGFVLGALVAGLVTLILQTVRL